MAQRKQRNKQIQRQIYDTWDTTKWTLHRIDGIIGNKELIIFKFLTCSFSQSYMMNHE